MFGCGDSAAGGLQRPLARLCSTATTSAWSGVVVGDRRCSPARTRHEDDAQPRAAPGAASRTSSPAPRSRRMDPVQESRWAAAGADLPLMRARILRGAEEVGGSCVELECDGQRIVLDLGLPLAAELDEQPPLPYIPGLGSDDETLLGVLVSHPHPDHYGLVPRISSSVPVYVGEAAERILSQASFFGPAGAELRVAGHLRDGVPIRAGAVPGHAARGGSQRLR